VPNCSELKQTDGGSDDVRSLAHRRWFGIGLCVLSMAVGALTFSLGFPQSGPSLSVHVVSHICHASYFPWFKPVAQVWVPWAAVLLLLSHPVFPRPVTVITTLIGGGLWWLMGWYCIAAVI
jgi:hypothetical protein